jgi:hypothetical protein
MYTIASVVVAASIHVTCFMFATKMLIYRGRPSKAVFRIMSPAPLTGAQIMAHAATR